MGNGHALQQIGAGLVRSLDEYNVGEDDGSDPAINAMTAQELMNQAAEHGGQVGRLLLEVQNTINGQGHND